MVIFIDALGMRLPCQSLRLSFHFLAPTAVFLRAALRFRSVTLCMGLRWLSIQFLCFLHRQLLAIFRIELDANHGIASIKIYCEY